MPSLVFVATEMGINNNKKIPKDKGVKLNKFKTIKASKVAMISLEHAEILIVRCFSVCS
ncbi:hypothetical protein N568_0106185 [Lactococcus garvieae TRF1]|uniref:Uncharacterized protein n=1 Tax=Lactococcus garvieae TRF1 TaxID=1380772 RepID=V8ARC4_9LACT|nr:hypothetical protein N568_0106185 [Lactococcus garvieae TRF1]